LQWIKQVFSSQIGKHAESLARQYLEQQGLHFMVANYRCRAGEIDLIMRHADTLVFIEVKYRRNAQHGAAVENFHAAKRHKFVATIAHYLHNQGINPTALAHRIDVVGIELNSRGQAEYTWLQNV
jgi:putative endonuclease